jgi:prepilin-type N-terminal cleavage/methylation domain-containing protein
MFRLQCGAHSQEKKPVPAFHLMRHQTGFTLIELVCTLVIISVLAAVLIPRYIDAETNAKMRGLDMGVAELNGRETLTWAMIKLSNEGYKDDSTLWGLFKVDPGTDLGSDYDWPGPPNIAGGTLRFKKEVTASLLRNGSNIETPGKWRR